MKMKIVKIAHIFFFIQVLICLNKVSAFCLMYVNITYSTDAVKLSINGKVEKNPAHIEERFESSELGVSTELKQQSLRQVFVERHTSPLTKFWDTLHVWADTTTFHGVRYVFDLQSHIFRRAIWFITIIGMLFFLVWNGQKQMNRYFEYKTLTIETVNIHEKIQFPLVTICSRHFIRNDSVINDTERILIEELLKSEPNRTRLVADFGEVFLNGTNFREVLVAHISNFDDFILSCKWKAMALNCGEYFSSRLTENGLCYSLRGSQDLFHTGAVGDSYGLEVVLWSGHDVLFVNEDAVHGIKVLVHESSDVPNMGLASLLGPGSLHYIAVASHVYDYMPHPAKAFGGQYCIDTTSDTDLYGHYSVASCYRKCRQDYFLKHCGCFSHFDKGDDGNDPDCSAYQIIDCYQPSLLSFMSQIDICHCPTPCHVTKYQTRHSSSTLPEVSYKNIQEKLSTDKSVDAIKENLIILKIFFESKEVIYHEQILEFTFEDLWASFGGYIGLAVGASCMTLMEILDLIVINIYHHVRNMRRLVRDSA